MPKKRVHAGLWVLAATMLLLGCADANHTLCQSLNDRARLTDNPRQLQGSAAPAYDCDHINGNSAPAN